MKNVTVSPFLKWAGGKRWLTTPEYRNIFPKSFNRYIEPFVGSGAIYFYLQPKKATLSDLNGALINTYKAIRSNWHAVKRSLVTHNKEHSKTYYYEMRGRSFSSKYQQAAQFIYLNRTCWNGLYRVNREGRFNVPIGTKNSVLLDTDNFSEIAKLLRRARLLNSDFERVIDSAEKGDFVFVDPPYTVCHDNNGFLKYNETIFSWDDQLRLRDTVFRAKRRGVKVLVLNANHNSLLSIYRGFGAKKSASRFSVISGAAEHRRHVKEAIIKSWS